MPYKDKAKQREAVRNASRKFRAKMKNKIAELEAKLRAYEQGRAT
jgi:hypothetical protein